MNWLERRVRGVCWVGLSAAAGRTKVCMNARTLSTVTSLIRCLPPWRALAAMACASLGTACFDMPSTLGLACESDAACALGERCELGNCVLDLGDEESGEATTGPQSDESGSGGETGPEGVATGGWSSGSDETGSESAGEESTGSADVDVDPVDAICGDSILNGAEICDGEDLGGTTCLDFGYGGGQPKCTFACDINIENCCLSAGQACGLGGETGVCCNGLTCGLLTGRCQ